MYKLKIHKYTQYNFKCIYSHWNFITIFQIIFKLVTTLPEFWQHCRWSHYSSLCNWIMYSYSNRSCNHFINKSLWKCLESRRMNTTFDDREINCLVLKHQKNIRHIFPEFLYRNKYVLFKNHKSGIDFPKWDIFSILFVKYKTNKHLFSEIKLHRTIVTYVYFYYVWVHWYSVKAIS